MSKVKPRRLNDLSKTCQSRSIIKVKFKYYLLYEVFSVHSIRKQMFPTLNSHNTHSDSVQEEGANKNLFQPEFFHITKGDQIPGCRTLQWTDL